MGQPLSVPPPGFDDLPTEDQIAYVQALWTRIAESQRAVPSPDWHLELVRERVAAHRADPTRARPWSEVEQALRAKLVKGP